MMSSLNDYTLNFYLRILNILQFCVIYLFFTFQYLQSYMPLPPAEENDNLSSNEEPKFQFSTVECLMLAFHQLGRKLPGFLADEVNADRLNIYF